MYEADLPNVIKPKIIFEDVSLPRQKPKDPSLTDLSEMEYNSELLQTKFSQVNETGKFADDQSFNDREAPSSFIGADLTGLLKAHINLFTNIQFNYPLRISMRNDENIISACELYEIEND
jgi:hypothetical protein